VHSRRSHAAELTPEQLASAARQVGLDFVAVTEHNTADTHDAWRQLAGDDLLVILGQEIVTQTGHWLALGVEPGQVIDWNYTMRDNRIGQAMAQVHRAGGLCIAAHPHAPYPSGTFAFPFEGFDAVEVWNGLWTSDLPWNADNEAALAEWGRGLAADIHRGRWRPAVGNSDAHLRGQLGTPLTVVRAPELDSTAVLAGIRAGRCWITESTTVGLFFTAEAGGRMAEIGDQLDADGQPVVVRIQISGVPSGSVSFHTDRGRAYQQVLSFAGTGSIEWSTNRQESMFVRAHVRHADGRMAALTNPILIS
jgi:PHP domain-containing protein